MAVNESNGPAELTDGQIKVKHQINLKKLIKNIGSEKKTNYGWHNFNTLIIKYVNFTVVYYLLALTLCMYIESVMII